MRHHPPRFVLLLLLALAALAIGGCGEGDEPPPSGDARNAATEPAGGGDDDAERGGAAKQADAALLVRLEHVGDKSTGAGIPIPAGISCDRKLPATCRGEVACPSEDDEVAGVCAWLAGAGRDLLLGEVPKDEICTEIYGGREVATVTGTLEGRKVERTFSRTNGCEINRFDMAAPLWTGVAPPPSTPAGGGAGAGGAAGACLRSDDPDAPVSSSGDADGGGSLADDTGCTPPHEPDVITDPPEAFGY